MPLQYLHLFFSCCSTLLTSININADITPTAPPEKEATMGSTWLNHSRKTVNRYPFSYQISTFFTEFLYQVVMQNLINDLKAFDFRIYLSWSGKCILRIKSSYEVPPNPNFSSSCYAKKIQNHIVSFYFGKGSQKREGVCYVNRNKKFAHRQILMKIWSHLAAFIFASLLFRNRYNESYKKSKE